MLHCSDCNKEILPESSCATTPEETKICYACAAQRDKIIMDSYFSPNPPQEAFILYLSGDQVSNWPNTLTFQAFNIRKGKHNIARTQIRVRFLDHKNRPWYGINIGGNQILRCKPRKIK
jgi:hypothetical protein